MRRIVLTYGLIAGAILGGMMLGSAVFKDRIDFDTAEIIGYTTMVAAFLMVYFGIRTYRDSIAGGTIGFGRAFKVGLLITGVAAVCYVGTWQLVYYKLSPDFVERYAAHEVEKARAAGETEAQIAKRKQEMARFSELYRNPFINVAWTFLEPLPVGLLFTLISAGLLSRRRQVVAASG